MLEDGEGGDYVDIEDFFGDEDEDEEGEEKGDEDYLDAGEGDEDGEADEEKDRRVIDLTD